MLSQLILRSTRPTTHLGAVRAPAPVAYRTLSTTPKPSSQGQSSAGQASNPPPGSSNTLIVLSALGALGGLYYYYARGQPAIDREAARSKEEEMEKKVREFGEAEKSKVEIAAKQGQRGYDQAKATVYDAATTARTRATEARTDLTDRARQSAYEAQVKFDELKNTADRKIGDVRDLSEKKFEEGKEEVRNAENKTRSWFGWGSSK